MDSHSPFFRPGGTLEPGAESYIPRAADEQLLAALLMGEYVFLLDSRQKGKSSLVAQTIVRLKEKGVRTTKLDIQRFGANVTPDQWYAGLLNGIGQDLGIAAEINTYWQEMQSVGPLARWAGAIETVVLRLIEDPIVIFIDEVDFVRSLPFSTDEFFAAIRDCYNRRSEVASYSRLTFCLVGVATPGQLIRNPEITPFNIGRRIELTDFSESDLAPYSAALSANRRDGEALISRIYHWVSGHPYLTQLLCSRLVEDPAIADADVLVKSLLLSPEARQREPNLADVERRMLDPDIPGLEPDEKRTQVLELYSRLLMGKQISSNNENPLIATLKLSGVSVEQNGGLVLRNRLYTNIFNQTWVSASLPDAERRRQKKAARNGAIKVGSISAVLITLLATFAGYAWKLSNERSMAVSRSTRSEAIAQRSAYNASMYLLSDQAGRGNWIRAVELLEKTRDSSARGFEWDYWNLVLNSQSLTLRSPPGEARITFLKDGTTFAVVTPGVTQLSDGTEIKTAHMGMNEAQWVSHLLRKLGPVGFTLASQAGPTGCDS